jgi:hypothetical protein
MILHDILQYLYYLAAVITPLIAAAAYYLQLKIDMVENKMDAYFKASTEDRHDLHAETKVMRNEHQALQLKLAEMYPTKVEFDRFEGKVMSALEKLDTKLDTKR